MKLGIIMMLLVLLSCSNSEKRVVVEMQKIEAIVNQHKSDSLNYIGKCKCYIKEGYVGESIKTASWIFDLKNVTHIYKYEQGVVQIRVLSPSSVKVSMFEEDYTPKRHQEILERNKKEAIVRLLNTSNEDTQKQICQSFKKAATLCGAVIKED